MIKTILNIPIQLAQNISTAINKFSLATKSPLQSNVLSSNSLIYASCVAFGVFLIYFFIGPFGISQYAQSDKLLLIGISSFAALLGLITTDIAFPTIFRTYFDKEKWTVSRQISLYILRFFFVGLAVMVFGNLTGLAHFDLPLFLLKFTAVGGFLGLIATFIKESSLRKKYQNRLISINYNIRNMETDLGGKNNFLVLKFTGSNDKINIIPNQLIRVEVKKYSSHFVYQNLFGLVKKDLSIRSKDVVKELQKHAQFVQLTKENYININAIYKASASAAGYKAFIAKKEEALFIPKKYQKTMESL